jgi:hypothetical protein
MSNEFEFSVPGSEFGIRSFQPETLNPEPETFFPISKFQIFLVRL